MNRVRWSWLAMVAMAGAFIVIGCCRHKKKELPAPARACESRYAIVEGRGMCEGILPGGDWTLVPRRESASYLPKRKRTAVIPNQPRMAAPDIQPFCVYEWARKEPPTADAFLKIGGTQECAVAVAMPPPAAPPGPPREPFFHRNFERQVKALASPGAVKDWETLQKAGKGAPVVAVLDASPYGVTKPDVSGHGFAISRIIGHLSCIGGADAPDCTNYVRPYVALPLVYTDGDWRPGPDGGFLGYFHDLFDAFEAALADKPENGHLIINLSLGW